MDAPNIDPDYTWLLGHLPKQQHLKPREQLAGKVAAFLRNKIETGQLPHTLGVFGSWGSGKTTFLAQLAQHLKPQKNLRVLYFNSWKYAGFMEIVPSLVYKILHYGLPDTDENRNKAAMRVLLSLGKEYSDRFGQWVEERAGFDPVGLFRDVYKLREIVAEGKEVASPKLLEAYYGQVDKAQDGLAEALGTIVPGTAAEHAIIVLIDELDRCDPDEAFNVIKQMRVLFAMRQLPLAFVVCANPEPIGLAIKHRYGLESASGDYEARRILEKFVDTYEDLSEQVSLAGLTREMWNESARNNFPWIITIDELNSPPPLDEDTIRNATAFDAITTAMPLYANLRVLQKSFHYVVERASWNRHLLWTIWHLEILNQIDPVLRNKVRLLSSQIRIITMDSYRDLSKIHYSVEQNGQASRLNYNTDKGRTLFAIYRSLFWENARTILAALGENTDPQSKDHVRILQDLLVDYRQLDFIILLSLLPFESGPSHRLLADVVTESPLPSLGPELDQALCHQFGWLIANC
jgi:hypothetical protein